MRKHIAAIGWALVWLLGSHAAPAAAADAEVRYLITNGGVDVQGNGQVHYFLHGQRDNAITWANSGDTAQMAPGHYDVHVTFSDGAAEKELWLDNQGFSGKVEKAVEMNLPIAEVSYVITNGGADTQGAGQVHYFKVGQRDNAVTWANSGDSVRLPQGSYDVQVSFSDGSAGKEIWLGNQAFAGKVQKTVEVGVQVAEVSYVITNGGVDTKDKGQAHYYASGHRDSVVTWAVSGDKVRLPQGSYDVQISYGIGLAYKELWLSKQSFAGQVQRSAEVNLLLAEPTVKVTQDGTDVGGAATIEYFTPGADKDFGGVRSGESTQVEQGSYDIRATMPGAEGWLRKAALSGKPHLSIAVVKPTTEVLQAGAPPPKACRIEVYGVNFDFNKAVLRPDSEPVLRQVLALFTGTPTFAAEVSGHTDNVGTADYNRKLSDDRANAVKAWLLAHGVAPTRVTAKGYGDTEPLVPNDSEGNRFKNRRVELRRNNCG